MANFKSNLPANFKINQKWNRVKSDYEKEEVSKILKEKYQDPEFKKKHKTAMETRDHSSDQEALEKRLKNPRYLINLRKGIDDFRNDPERMAEYKENNREAYLKSKEDPQYWEKYYAAIAVRDSNPEYHKKRIEASKKKICKKVHTPLGIFDSITDASKAYGMGNSETMRHRIKSPNFPDFYIIEEKND